MGRNGDSLDKELRRNRFRVVIFGSARITQGTKDYEQVFALAKMIGAEGIDIVTGGGPGLMDAAMSGHNAGRKDSSIREIGLQIKLPEEQPDSSHFDVKREFHRFSARLDTFMRLANVVVVAPGGVGTMLEMLYTWQLIQVRHSCPIPIIMVGDMWPDFVEWVRRWPLKKGLLDKDDVDVLFLARDNQEVMEIIRHAHMKYLDGNAACLNIDIYKT